MNLTSTLNEMEDFKKAGKGQVKICAYLPYKAVELS